jgi:hypothetical protein
MQMFQRLKAEDEANAQQSYGHTDGDGWTNSSWVEQPADTTGHWEEPKASFPVEQVHTEHAPITTQDESNASHQAAIRGLERQHEEQLSAAQRSQRLVQEQLEALKRQVCRGITCPLT